jgi:hypothetical protein
MTAGFHMIERKILIHVGAGDFDPFGRMEIIVPVDNSNSKGDFSHKS